MRISKRTIKISNKNEPHGKIPKLYYIKAKKKCSLSLSYSKTHHKNTHKTSRLRSSLTSSHNFREIASSKVQGTNLSVRVWSLVTADSTSYLFSLFYRLRNTLSRFPRSISNISPLSAFFHSFHLF